MNQLRKVLKNELVLEDIVDTKISFQGRGQDAPDDKGVDAGKTLRRSIGRIEDLDRSNVSSPLGGDRRETKLRRKLGKIGAYLEAEKRRLAACIEREEAVEQRLNEEIYKGTSENAEMERKRQKILESLHGKFDFKNEED